MSSELGLVRAATGLLDGSTGPFWVWAGTSAATGAFGLLVVLLLARARRWQMLVACALAVAAADLSVSRLLKPAFARERPCEVDPDVGRHLGEVGGRCGSGASFPSAHAANTAAVAAVTGAPVLVGAAVVVGASRVVLAQHYPSDVVAGWAYGALVGGAVGVLARRAAQARAPAPAPRPPSPQPPSPPSPPRSPP